MSHANAERFTALGRALPRPSRYFFLAVRSGSKWRTCELTTYTIHRCPRTGRNLPENPGRVAPSAQDSQSRGEKQEGGDTHRQSGPRHWRAAASLDRVAGPGCHMTVNARELALDSLPTPLGGYLHPAPLVPGRPGPASSGADDGRGRGRAGKREAGPGPGCLCPRRRVRAAPHGGEGAAGPRHAGQPRPER